MLKSPVSKAYGPKRAYTAGGTYLSPPPPAHCTYRHCLADEILHEQSTASQYRIAVVVVI